MKRWMVLGSALLFTASSLAQAGESQEPKGASPETVAPTETPAAAPAREAVPAPVPPPIASVQPNPEPGVQEPVGPQPYTGWARGVRAPIYVNLMFSAGIFTEDGSNRLTTRDSKLLEGFGGVFRVGAVLGPHHRLGARMQSFVRPTKKVLLDPPGTSNTNSEWGAVSFGYVGPEYLYVSDLGIYAGGSVGVAGAMSRSNFDDDDDKHVERGSAGVAGIASVGYEWRANKWFAMNAEVFGGLYHGIDDDDNSMNGALFGLGLGLGF